MYSRLCKKKKRAFVQTVFTKLDLLVEKDPETYWNMKKELKGDSSNDGSDPSKNIPSTTWENYFSKLFSVKPEFERQNNYCNYKLDSSCNTILDSEISEQEILAAVKEL